MLHSIFYIYTLTGWPIRRIKGDMVSFLVTRSSKAAGLQQYNWCHGTESAAVSRQASQAGGRVSELGPQWRAWGSMAPSVL